MKLAVLFWFYKEPDICKNRINILKKFNPTLDIFGLYGGPPENTSSFKSTFGDQLADLYTVSDQIQTKPKMWKWRNGDLMLLDWFENAGKDLTWDSVAIVQWDALILASLSEYFPDLQQNQIVLSGFRELDKTLEKKWYWTRNWPILSDRKNFIEFKEYVSNKYSYQGPFYANMFAFQIIPRSFFEKFVEVDHPEIGFSEYKISTYAKIFGNPFYGKDLGVYWPDKPKKFKEAAIIANGINIKRSIQEDFIRQQLSKKDGYRIFHPYFKIYI